MRRDWTTHVSGICHRTLDRGMTLCMGQITKKNLKSINTSYVMIEVNAGGKLVKTKYELGLLERLTVIARC